MVMDSTEDKRGLAERCIEQLSLETIGSHLSCPVNYIWAAKCGCSSIKATLLGIDGNPHQSFQNEFCSSSIDISKPFFCVTRNPYDRIVSAYYDKIADSRGNELVWSAFCNKYGLSASSSITFSEFLAILCADKEKHRLDEHFRAQAYLNNHAFVQPRFVGRLERIGEVKSFLSSFGIEWIDFRSHMTGAMSKRNKLTPDDIAVIRNLYRLDFEVYKYSEDHLSDYCPASIYQEQIVTRELRLAAQLRGDLSPEEIVVIRRVLLRPARH